MNLRPFEINMAVAAVLVWCYVIVAVGTGWVR